MTVEECKHEEFNAHVEVHRLESSGRFMADVRIECLQCKQPMRFLGLPIGSLIGGAACSPDGTEARLAIHPVNEGIPGLRGPSGFLLKSPKETHGN